jgi:putative transposase
MGIATRKQYTPEQKVQIVLEYLKEERSLSQLASEHGIHHSQIVRWKKQAMDHLPSAFSSDITLHVVKASYERKMESLYQEIGHLSTQLNWLKKKSGMS